MEYKCTKCTNSDSIPDHMSKCPVCGAQCPAPNVRAAQSPIETSALADRLSNAEVLAKTLGTEGILSEFGKSVESSAAVVACSLSRAKAVIASGEHYNSYYKQVSSGSRVPADNKFDAQRRSVDAKFFPNYEKEMNFAALSISGKGIKAYGPAHLVLKEEAMAERSSVFAMNTFVFAEMFKIGLTDPIPEGYRAPWGKRSELAMAQLHSSITSETTESTFDSILLNPEASRDDASFIEVHIYGEFSRGAIDSVYLIDSSEPADKLIARSIQAELKKLKIPSEIE